MGFRSFNIASKAIYFSEEIDKFCHSNEDNFMMELLADITRLGLDNKLFLYDDLFNLTEDDLWNVLSSYNDYHLIKNIESFKNVKKEEVPIINLGNVKIRDINPLVNGVRLKDMI